MISKPFFDNTPIDIRLVLRSGTYNVSDMLSFCFLFFVIISHSTVPIPFTFNCLPSPTFIVEL